MTPGSVDPTLARDIEALAVPGLLIDHRVISAGDENALLDEEAASIASPVIAVRRASGTARIVARALLTRFGYVNAAVPRGEAGAPVWPAGISGSLAHDDRIAVAAVGLQRDVALDRPETIGGDADFIGNQFFVRFLAHLAGEVQGVLARRVNRAWLREIRAADVFDVHPCQFSGRPRQDARGVSGPPGIPGAHP